MRVRRPASIALDQGREHLEQEVNALGGGADLEKGLLLGGAGVERGGHMERECRRLGGERATVGLEVVQLAKRREVVREGVGEGGAARGRRHAALAVVEGLDHGDEIGRGVIEVAGDEEARGALDDDVGAAVGEGLGAADLGDTAHGAQGRRFMGDAGEGQAESFVTGDTIGEHPAVAGLEDVQGKQGAGEEDDAEWEDGEAERHGGR